MRARHRGLLLGVLALLVALAPAACRRTFVIVPRPEGGYTRVDTLYGVSRGNRVQVTFHFDTTWRRDTVVRVDTAWRAGTRTLLRVDTLRLPIRIDTVVRVDTVTRVTTRVRVDTVTIPEAIPYTPPVPTPVPTPAPTPVPVPAPRVDTIRIVRVDTVTVTRRDTLFRVDTVRVRGQRVLFVPPGQYPPEGMCRIWIHDLPPGRQADPAPCDQLGAIPAGAFILFRGAAWDFDYDWVEASRQGGVPPEIVALSRRRRP